MLAEIARRAPAGGYGAILDVGCGDGLFFPKLAKYGSVEGVEEDSSTLSEEAERYGRIWRQPFDAAFQPGRSFGLVTMLDVVEHVVDDAACMARAAALLAPGGLLVATVPAFQALWTAHDAWNHHHRRYARGAFVKLVAGAGLAVLASRYFFHWPAPLKLLVRAKEALAGTKPEMARTPPAPVNRALYWLSRLEAATLGRLDLPFGSSVIVVARRP